MSRRKSRYSVVRSVFSDILLRFAGGGPSLSDDMPPSGTGEPLCEVCWLAGGDGYGTELAREREWQRMMSSGGVGDRESSDNGEHERDEGGALLRGEERRTLLGGGGAEAGGAAMMGGRCGCRRAGAGGNNALLQAECARAMRDQRQGRLLCRGGTNATIAS